MSTESRHTNGPVGQQVNGEEASDADSDEATVIHAEPSERVKLKYRPDIAGLRGLGVIVIVLAHADIHFLRNGFIFVDAFYVVSGFLITGLLAKEYERLSKQSDTRRLTIINGKPKRRSTNYQISLKNFYIRRAQRILPAALFVAWSTVLFARFFFNSTQVAAVTSDALWVTFFGANVHFMTQSTDYFHFGEQTSPLQHYWSLSIEEQFYAVWPILFIFATGLPFLKLIRPYLSWRGRVTLVLGTVTLASFVWMFVSFSMSPLTTYFSTTARAWELGIGGLVAINVHSIEKLNLRTRELMAWAAVVMFSLSMIYVNPANFGYTLWIPVFSVALLLAVGHGAQQPFVFRFLSVKFLQVMGLLSYSIYLWHWPVFTFAKDLGYLKNWWQTSAVILLSLLLAVITYFFVERPFHRMQLNFRFNSLVQFENSRSKKARKGYPSESRSAKHRRSWSHSVWTLLVALLTLSLVLIAPTIAEVIEKRTNGTSNYATPGALNRIWTSADAPSSLTQVEQRWQSKLEDALTLKVAPKSLTTSLADLKNQKNALFKECLYLSTAEQDRGCVLGSASPKAKLAVVIGDSTALSMSAAITGALDLNHWRIQILTRAQCPVADVTPVVNGKPDEKCPIYRNRVFARLAELHPDLVFLSEGSVTDNVRPSGVSHLQFWARGYARSLALLKTVTPQTVAIFEPPRTPAAVSCVRSNGEVRTCFARGNEDQAYLSVTTRIAKRYNVHLVVPAKWLCLKGVCPAIIDNTAVKFDDKHISIDMAKKLAPLLKADLIKARVITD